jgi:hypothetical protein
MQSINNGPSLRILDVGAGRGETSLGGFKDEVQQG